MPCNLESCKNFQLPRAKHWLTGIAFPSEVSFVMIFNAVILNKSKLELFILKKYWKRTSNLYTRFNSSTSSINKSFMNSSVLYCFSISANAETYPKPNQAATMILLVSNKCNDNCSSLHCRIFWIISWNFFGEQNIMQEVNDISYTCKHNPQESFILFFGIVEYYIWWKLK